MTLETLSKALQCLLVCSLLGMESCSGLTAVPGSVTVWSSVSWAACCRFVPMLNVAALKHLTTIKQLVIYYPHLSFINLHYLPIDLSLHGTCCPQSVSASRLENPQARKRGNEGEALLAASADSA